MRGAEYFLIIHCLEWKWGLMLSWTSVFTETTVQYSMLQYCWKLINYRVSQKAEDIIYFRVFYGKADTADKGSDFHAFMDVPVTNGISWEQVRIVYVTSSSSS